MRTVKRANRCGGSSAIAEDYAEEAMAREPAHPGSPIALIAVTTRTTGWAAAQSLMPEWLGTCPAWYVHRIGNWLVVLFRKIREQDGMPALAEMLRGVEHQDHWKPWSDAVSALASGNGHDACTSDESRSIYDRLA
jgi:hypothetical protein